MILPDLNNVLPIVQIPTLPTNKFLDGNRKDPIDNDNATVFPAFDLSTKRIEFGNINARVTTVAYEIECYPDHATLLKFHPRPSLGLRFCLSFFICFC